MLTCVSVLVPVQDLEELFQGREACFGDEHKENDVSSLVETEKRESIFLIGINRPHVRNCVNNQTACSSSRPSKLLKMTSHHWLPFSMEKVVPSVQALI
ncbi:hypothetical protein Bbelb_003050 [Branchiostoma belcheri]|nr:hypothetical protein Bbelb_003050 [Branchiostoma belcheri]